MPTTNPYIIPTLRKGTDIAGAGRRCHHARKSRSSLSPDLSIFTGTTTALCCGLPLSTLLCGSHIPWLLAVEESISWPSGRPMWFQALILQCFQEKEHYRQIYLLKDGHSLAKINIASNSALQPYFICWELQLKKIEYKTWSRTPA